MRSFPVCSFDWRLLPLPLSVPLSLASRTLIYVETPSYRSIAQPWTCLCFCSCRRRLWHRHLRRLFLSFPFRHHRRQQISSSMRRRHFLSIRAVVVEWCGLVVLCLGVGVHQEVELQVPPESSGRAGDRTWRKTRMTLRD